MELVGPPWRAGAAESSNTLSSLRIATAAKEGNSHAISIRPSRNKQENLIAEITRSDGRSSSGKRLGSR
jgi:hypothetical protein